MERRAARRRCADERRTEQKSMAKANIRDRRSIARIYPPDAFASDAARNGEVKSQVLRGLRIASAPDAAGVFDLEPARQQVGEMPDPAFLAPHRREDRLAQSEHVDPRAGYEEFLDDVIAAATRFGFQAEESPGPGDPRLRGLRQ
jgi:hypothetical protein